MKVITANPSFYLSNTRKAKANQIADLSQRVNNYTNSYRNGIISHTQTFQASVPVKQGINYGYGYVAGSSPLRGELNYGLAGKSAFNIENISGYKLTTTIAFHLVGTSSNLSNYSFPLYYLLNRQLPNGEVDVTGSIYKPLLCIPLGTINWNNATGYTFAGANTSFSLELLDTISSRQYIDSVGVYDFSHTTTENQNNKITAEDLNVLLGSNSTALFTSIVADVAGLSAGQQSHLDSMLGANGAYQVNLTSTYIMQGLAIPNQGFDKDIQTKIASSHANNQARVYTSHNLDAFNNLIGVYTPPSGNILKTTITKYSNTFYLVYQRSTSGNTFGVASSPDLINWELERLVGVTGATNVVNPNIITIGIKRYLLMGVSYNSGVTYDTIIYDTNFSNFNNIFSISINSNNASGSIIKKGDTYNFFFFNPSSGYIERATSNDIFSNYTAVNTGNWINIGLANDPRILKTGLNTYRLCYTSTPDSLSYYIESNDLVNWTKPVRVVANNVNLTSISIYDYTATN